MRRETANVLLLLLGGALLKLAFSGDYLRYVKPQHQWWMIAGGLVMVLLGGVAIWRDIRDDSAQPSEEHHAHGSQRSAWLLVVPVLAVLFVAPPALGADSVTRSLDGGGKSYDAASTQAYPPLPEGRVTAMPISQFHSRAMWDDKRTLADRSVLLRGFVVQKDGQTYLARMVIGCCAADGYPVMVRLAGPPELGAFRNDEWIAVTGQHRAGSKPPSESERRENVPELTVEKITRMRQPSDPYEY